ncbi:Beta-amylase [Quillaja saponaria]|uniref:Beta-amylase n=1 Tax=Quillaja saponaria TaxID=32244 RepID=A0AAD7PN65_QUISA|nr:Beta-amylase [Quillaja saponaria]
MSMTENGGMACECARRRSFELREVTFEEKRRYRKNLRNVSMIPLFRKGFFSRLRSVAGNSCLLSMDAQEKSRTMILKLSRHKRIRYMC